MSSPTISPSAEVMTALRFSLEDLAFNRAGKLSPSQTVQLYKHASLSVALALGAFVVVLVVFLVVKPRGLVLLLFGALSLGSAALFAWLAWSSVADAISRHVVAAQGALSFVNIGRGAGIIVGGQRLPMEPCAHVLVRGAEYRVYYLPSSDTFLSLEPLAVERNAAGPSFASP